MYIYPYKQGSQTVARLSAALNARTIRLENSKFKGSPDKVVINWGNSVTNEEIEKANVLNLPAAVALATNKLTFFQHVENQLSIPTFTTDKTVADGWINKGKKVVVREILNGHSGNGIRLFNNPQTWEDYDHSRAKLYVMYIPKKDEYRVHVVGGEVIDVQRKAARSDVPVHNYEIRNHDNGFIYAREGVRDTCPQDVIDQSVLAVNLTGLHFGAVDTIYNLHYAKAYVLEINTAPGLEGTSVDNYAAALTNLASNTYNTLSWVTTATTADLGELEARTDRRYVSPLQRHTIRDDEGLRTHAVGVRMRPEHEAAIAAVNRPNRNRLTPVFPTGTAHGDSMWVVDESGMPEAP